MAEIWADYRFCSAAWNTAVLQGHRFVSQLDPFPQESNHAKFELKRLRNGWVITDSSKKDKFILFFYFIIIFIILPTDNSTIANARFSFSLALAGDGNKAHFFHFWNIYFFIRELTKNKILYCHRQRELN